MDFQRIFILLGLAVTAYFIILAWNEDYGQGRNQETDPVAAERVTSEKIGAEAHTIPPVEQLISHDDDAQTAVIPSLDAPKQAITTPSVVAETDRFVVVQTDVLIVTIDKVGGDITSVSLRHFPTSLDTPDEPFVLVDPKNYYSVQSGLIGPSGTDTPAGRPRFSTTSNHFSIGEAEELTVQLRLVQDTGIRIYKEFRFPRSSYLIDIRYVVDNRTTGDWTAAVFAQIKRDSLDPDTADSNVMGMQPFIGGATRASDVLYQKLEFDDIEEESYRAKHPGGYMAMVQHYFVTALIPVQEEEHTYLARKLPGQDIYLFGFTSPLWTVKAGNRDSKNVQFYAGPKDQYRLAEIAEGLDLTIDYGFLWWLAQPLFYLLTTIQGFVVNWGVAIMLLTLIVKLVLYPLSAASFRSNAKLRKLQPEMVKLREQHGDDRQKLSQGMMDLYKKEGANPLGGCFPLLLQMPVFIALYWVLLESVELRQAPFALWIHDLSAMDPYFVLPILMGISMYLVTMMQPEPPDPMQAKIFKMMPIMFTFFFLWFPAGLVLYWLVNNVLSILQQWHVTRQLDAT